MRAAIIVTMLLMPQFTWGNIPEDPGIYRCVSHTDFGFSNLEILRDEKKGFTWLWDGKELTNFSISSVLDIWGGILFWPTDPNTGKFLDEIYCKKN